MIRAMPSGSVRRALRTRAFGLDLRFDSFDPPGAWAERREGADDVVLAAASVDEMEADWSGLAAPGWEATIDGADFAVERGVAGDHRFSRDGRALAVLDPAAASVLCAIDDGGRGTGNWRALLDSVLFSVALLRGLEALHAGAVVIGERALAISAGPGGGKSTLLAELIDEGAALLSDDVVALSPRPGERPIAHPGPPLMTVPSTLRRPPGEPFADLGEELWRAVPTVAAPLPLGAIVLLDRSGEGAPRLEAVERPLAPLLAGLLNFPRTAEREGARFDLAATLAESVPIRRLRASAEAAPSELAATLRAEDFDTDPRHH
jgi:hypothetical protein